jgi:hypothetical protein
MAVNGSSKPRTTQFLFDGFNARTLEPMPEGDVSRSRAQYMSSYQSKEWHTYPSPAYNIHFDPTTPKAEVQQFMEEVKAARYIDLGTKAVFVDATVYNPQLDIICWCRLTAEMVR